MPVGRGGQDKVEPLSRPSGWNAAEIVQERQRLWRSEAIEGQVNLTQEAIEVQQIVCVRRKRVGRAAAGVEVPEESSNFWDRVLLVIQKLE